MISGRLVRARMRAGALPTLAVLGMLAMCAAFYGREIRDLDERETRATRIEHWEAGPIRAERDLAKLEQPGGRP